jgi:small subunit ribosomal protein S16
LDLHNLHLSVNLFIEMLIIRLQRVGRKHEPVFRLVLTDSKNSTKSGKFLAILGSYDSRRAEEAKFNNEKVLYWISKGAQVSDTIHNLLLKGGVIQGVKRNVLSKKPVTKKIEEKTQEPVTAEIAAEPTSPDEILAEGEAEIESKPESMVE